MGREFLRHTKQRAVILEELRKVTSHPRAMDLYEMVRRQLPRISLGTVYRNLELLSEMGAIQKLTTSGGEARYDGNADPHYHIRCVRCQRVEDVHELADELVTDVPAEVNGYRILGYRFELLGECAACRRQASAN